MLSTSRRINRTVCHYVQALYELAEHAEFGNKEIDILDRLVVGVQDRDLSEKIQLEAGLTLETAIARARQHEQVKSHMAEQRATVDAVQSGGASEHGGGNRGRGGGGCQSYRGGPWGNAGGRRGSNFQGGGDRHPGDGFRGGGIQRVGAQRHGGGPGRCLPTGKWTLWVLW